MTSAFRSQILNIDVTVYDLIIIFSLHKHFMINIQYLFSKFDKDIVNIRGVIQFLVNDVRWIFDLWQFFSFCLKESQLQLGQLTQKSNLHHFQQGILEI